MDEIKVSEKRVNKKQMAKRSVSVLLVAALLITGLFAFLTATDSKTNVFTVGNIAIKLFEDDWYDHDDYDDDGTVTWLDDDGDASGEPGTANNGIPDFAENMLPGEEVPKAPYVTNTGSNPAWTYLVIKVPTVPVDDILDNNGTITVTNTANDGNRFTIDVTAYAIQEGYGGSDNDTAQEIWNAYGQTIPGNEVADLTDRAPLFTIRNNGTDGFNNVWTLINTVHSDDGNDYYVLSYGVLENDTQTATAFTHVLLNPDIGNPNPNAGTVGVYYYYQAETPGNSGSGAGEADLGQTLTGSVEWEGKTYNLVSSKRVVPGAKLGKLYYDVNIMDTLMSQPEYWDITHDSEVLTTSIINEDTHIIISQVPNSENEVYEGVYENVVPDGYYTYYVTNDNKLVFLGIHEDYMFEYKERLENLLSDTDDIWAELYAIISLYDDNNDNDNNIQNVYNDGAQDKIDELEDTLTAFRNRETTIDVFRNGNVVAATYSSSEEAKIQARIERLEKIIDIVENGASVTSDELQEYNDLINEVDTLYTDIEDRQSTADSPFIDIVLPSKVTPGCIYDTNEARVWWYKFDTLNPDAPLSGDVNDPNAIGDPYAVSDVPVKTAHGYFVGNTANLSTATAYPITNVKYNQRGIGSIGKMYKKVVQYQYSEEDELAQYTYDGVTYDMYVNEHCVSFILSQQGRAEGKISSEMFDEFMGDMQANYANANAFSASLILDLYDTLPDDTIPFIITHTLETSLDTQYTLDGKGWERFGLANENDTVGAMQLYDVDGECTYGAYVPYLVLRTNNGSIPVHWTSMYIEHFAVPVSVTQMYEDIMSDVGVFLTWPSSMSSMPYYDNLPQHGVTEITEWPMDGDITRGSLYVPKSVTKLPDIVNSANGRTDTIYLYYEGTEEEWNALNVNVTDTSTRYFKTYFERGYFNQGYPTHNMGLEDRYV